MTPETLVRDSEAAEATPEHVDAAAPDAVVEVAPVERPCPSCGAALADDQEWCLECGTATTGRSGGLPGWRTAAATIAICLTLASGAVAAAYAAINAESGPNRQGDALIAQAPIDDGEDLGAAPALAGPQPPASEAAPPPVDPPDASSSAPAPVPTPAPVSPTPSFTPSPTPTPIPTDTGDENENGGDTGEDGDGGEDKPPVEQPVVQPPALVDLVAAVPTTYDPAGRPVETFTDPALAIDGDPSTAWTATLTPEEIVAPDVGIQLDLGEAIGVRRLDVKPTADGTTIEVLGSKRAVAPKSADGAGWIPLATQLDVSGKTRIDLGDGTDEVRHLLVRFVDGPVDGSTSVGISELSLYE